MLQPYVELLQKKYKLFPTAVYTPYAIKTKQKQKEPPKNMWQI